MAHFAQLDENNVVVTVLVVDNNVLMDNGVENEQLGIDFLTGLLGHSKWKQTSYNNKFRGVYAGIGYTYDESLDRFIPPKPYGSWTYDLSKNCWQPPVPYPVGDDNYQWDEDSLSWKLFQVNP